LLSIQNYIGTGNNVDTVFSINQNHIKDFKNGGDLWIGLNHSFPHGMNTQVALFAKDTLIDKNLFWEQRYLFHFCNGQPNNFQLGDYWFAIPPINPTQSTKLYFLVYYLPKGDKLNQIKVKFLKP
jgi:hypothetical protein